MPVSEKSRNEVTLYIIVTVVITSLVGAIVGAIFDGSPLRGSVSIIAAFAAVVVELLLRRYVGRSLPQFFLNNREEKSPLSIWLGAIVTAIAAGLATSTIFVGMGLQAGFALGLLAGLFAGLITSVLVVLHDLEHHKA